jgi:CO/xanthine dehydrogenase Mo-binding subunit
MKAKLVSAVAASWEVDPQRVVVSPGFYADRDDPTRQIPVVEALILGEAMHGTLSTQGGYRTQKLGGDYRGGTIGASPAYSATAHVAEVEVDMETGRVTVTNLWAAHDCGRALNPVMVEGQIEGSVYMGVSECLLEDMAYRESGLHLGPNLLDYRISTSKDLPNIEAHIVESIDPGGPYGAKEAGEGPLHPAIPAIANAIWHATGVRLRDMPFSPEKVLAAIQERNHAANA